MTITIYIGNQLKKFRIEKGLSQEQLALLSAMDRTYISDIELGKRHITVISLEKILNSLSISFADFFREYQHDS